MWKLSRRLLLILLVYAAVLALLKHFWSDFDIVRALISAVLFFVGMLVIRPPLQRFLDQDITKKADDAAE